MNEHLADDESCPLCGRGLWRSKVLLLYGVRVCKKCYYGLANRRQLAFILDVFLIWLIGVAAWYALLLCPVSALDNIQMLSWLGSIAGLLAYGIKDGFGGRSPGKWLLGLQVRRCDTHEPIGIGASLVRNSPIMILYTLHVAVSLMLVYTGGFRHLPLVNLGYLGVLLIIAYQLKRGPRWGDGLAGTKVVRVALAHRSPFDNRGTHCTNCGYDLTGNVSGVCPECGMRVMQRADGMGQPDGRSGIQSDATVARSQDHFAERG